MVGPALLIYIRPCHWELAGRVDYARTVRRQFKVEAVQKTEPQFALPYGMPRIRIYKHSQPRAFTINHTYRPEVIEYEMPAIRRPLHHLLEMILALNRT